jgi:hypothetical protein
MVHLRRGSTVVLTKINQFKKTLTVNIWNILPKTREKIACSLKIKIPIS